MEYNDHKQLKNPLWTRDFTIITLGSVVSMLGSTLAGFAMSLLVLDYTGSTFYYAMYQIMYFLPYVVMPVLSGPFLDRFSRRKTIYTLDFITSAFYLVCAAVVHFGKLNFGFLAIGTLIIGTIGSIYQVAYQSFYPLLITKGNFSKAYSVASTLETLTMVMVPFSALIYNSIGITPIFLINTCTYLIAAIFETQIRQKEEYIEKRASEELPGEASKGIKRFVTDFREGIGYLKTERGLLFITIYFVFSQMTGGAGSSLSLPYFKGSFENGEYIYMIVWGAASLARAVGGILHYRFKIPVEHKYSIALFVYIAISFLEGAYLFLPIPLMVVCTSLTGILGVTSYNIRISATQRYVPDEKKGRFNGAFNTLTMIGMLLGEFAAGVMSLRIPIRGIIVIFHSVCLVAALVFIGGHRREVSGVYNTQD